MITPPYLQKGDTVAFVSPAKTINEKEVEFAKAFLTSKGLKVILGSNALNNWNRFSGTDEERLNDFQVAINDPSIKAIFCSRGGYGSVRIVDELNYSALATTPKWIIGYSDITVFHNHLHTNFGIKTIHGPMPLNIINEKRELESAEQLIDVLFGSRNSISFNQHKLNRNGTCTGNMVGGNLSVFCGLIGTNSDVDTTDSILFLEDLYEENYKLDRMMYQLKKSGKFDNLNGLLLGGFTEMTDLSKWFDVSSLEIIANHVKEYNFPVAFNFPAGHTPTNTPIVIGQEYSLEVNDMGSKLDFR